MQFSHYFAKERWLLEMHIDSQIINKITTKYRFLISQLDAILNQMVGAQWFYKLDLHS